VTARVYLAGAGPGDPELLTLKALRVLREADAVLHDSLVGAPILNLVNHGTHLIDVGKRCGGQAMPQNEINAMLVAQARQGGTVATQ
jgi:siroheme synthase